MSYKTTSTNWGKCSYLSLSLNNWQAKIKIIRELGKWLICSWSTLTISINKQKASNCISLMTCMFVKSLDCYCAWLFNHLLYATDNKY